MENRDNESRLRELTMTTLQNSSTPIAEIKSLFVECSDAFEAGDDKNGMLVMQRVLTGLGQFGNFCANLSDVAHGIISEQDHIELSRMCEILTVHLSVLTGAMEETNLTEVGDILRFDLFDLMTSFDQLFKRIAENMQASVENG